MSSPKSAVYLGKFGKQNPAGYTFQMPYNLGYRELWMG
jgi:hypothetical protein